MSKKEQKDLERRVKAMISKGIEDSYAELWARMELEERREDDE